MYDIEEGDFVKFKEGLAKRFKWLNTKFNIPQCLYGLKVGGKDIDRDTKFLVLSVISNGCAYASEITGVLLAVDGYDGGMFFDISLVEFYGF